MSDTDAIDLVQAALDGELDSSRRPELEQALAADPALAGVQQDLARVIEAVESLEEQAPPAGLSMAVMAAAPTPGPEKPTRSLMAIWPGSTALRYAYLFAIGLIFGATAHELIRGENPMDDFALFAGTMTSGSMVASQDIGAASSNDVEITADGMVGTVKLYRSEGLLAIEVDLESASTVELIADLGGNHISGIARLESELPDLSTNRDAARFELQGHRRFAVFLSPDPGAVSTSPSLEIRRGGEVLQRIKWDDS